MNNAHYELSLDQVKNNTHARLAALIEAARANPEASVESLIEQCPLSQDITNVATGLFNLKTYLSPVLFSRVEVYPELGMNINETLSGTMLDICGWNNVDFVNEHYPDQGYVVDRLPEVVAATPEPYEIVTHAGKFTAFWTVFRFYHNAETGAELNLSEMPIFKVADGWVVISNVAGWRKLEGEEATKAIADEIYRLEEFEGTVYARQIAQTEKWILEGGLATSLGEQSIEDLDSQAEISAEIPLPEDLATEIKGAIAEQVPHLSPVDEADKTQ